MADGYAEALGFLREARSISNLPELEARFAGVISHFGYHETSCVLMAQPGRPIRPRVLFGLGDIAARNSYIASGRQRIDPTFKAVFAATRAFTWTDVEALATTEEARDLFLTARRDGTEGLIVPVHGAFGEVSAVVLTGRGCDVSEQARAVLQACGAMFAVAGVQLAELEADRPSGGVLTRRETQVLIWLSRGKTVPDAAEILDISIGTAKTHLERAKAKLGHLATIPTVLEAARRGWLIDPDEFD
ncbi:MAG TPA: autoinducer binding domain-containing protein [Phenylobacterium sp.]|jgi:DNA-binding CsgD family transcriptional regulator|nr:autoinducer binding domain-containing protein [Phenylobacterium sp.]